MQYLFCVIVVAFVCCGCAERVDSLNYRANLPQNAMLYVIDESDEMDLGESSEFGADSGANLSESNIDSSDSSTNLRDSNTQKVAEIKELKKKYLKRHFSVWEENFRPPKAKDMFWAIYDKSGFDESKKPINARFFTELVKSININSYPNERKIAIMVKSANIRALPTNKPRFSKIDGYPFDRWQNSLIFAYTPIIVLHSDKSKEWLLVQSSFVSGWVKADEVAFVSQKQAREMMSADFVLPMEDKIPLYHNGLFLQNARVGMLLPTIKGSSKGDSKRQILAFKRDINGDAIKIRVDFDKKLFAPFPLPLSNENIAKMIERIGAENYGWGGMYENRDCSSFVRDIFANVGIWLPRNSKAQVDYGKRAKGSEFIALPKDNDAKIALILSRAKPFRTIIWLKGHIMLYIGAIKGNPIVAHQVWGISSKNGTEILSAVSITTLTPQIDIEDGIIVKNDLDSKQSLLDKIEAINILW